MRMTWSQRVRDMTAIPTVERELSDRVVLKRVGRRFLRGGGRLLTAHRGLPAQQRERPGARTRRHLRRKHDDVQSGDDRRHPNR